MYHPLRAAEEFNRITFGIELSDFLRDGWYTVLINTIDEYYPEMWGHPKPSF